jgi:hypothetical protein
MIDGQSSRDCGASGGQQGGRRSCGEKQQWVQARGCGEREVHGRHMHCCCCYVHRHASIAALPSLQLPVSLFSLGLQQPGQDTLLSTRADRLSRVWSSCISSTQKKTRWCIFLPLQIGILGFEEAQFRLALCCMVKTIYCCFTVMMW